MRAPVVFGRFRNVGGTVAFAALGSVKLILDPNLRLQ
jgi:hypothetical protein